MNGPCSIAIAGFLAFTASATVARAGEIGTTSRASISISVTVPPHVEISRAQSAGAGPGEGFCVRPSGISNYRIGFLPAGSSDATAAVPLSEDVGRGLCGLLGPSGGTIVVPAATESAAGSSAGPPTLLVIPN